MRRYLCRAILILILFNIINISLVMVLCQWLIARLTLSRRKTPRVIAFFLPLSLCFPTCIHSNAHISFLVANSFHMRGGKQLMPTKWTIGSKNDILNILPISLLLFMPRTTQLMKQRVVGLKFSQLPTNKLQIQGMSTRTGLLISLSGNPDLKANLFMGHSHKLSISFSLTTTSYNH